MRDIKEINYEIAEVTSRLGEAEHEVKDLKERLLQLLQEKEVNVKERLKGVEF